MPRSRTGKFTIDHGGVQALLKSEELHSFINGKVDEVASSLEGEVQAKTNFGRDEQEVRIGSSHYTTDRAAGSVTLMHPAGVALEAKYGHLKKAAEAAGFEWGRHNV